MAALLEPSLLNPLFLSSSSSHSHSSSHPPNNLRLQKPISPPLLSLSKPPAASSSSTLDPPQPQPSQNPIPKPNSSQSEQIIRVSDRSKDRRKIVRVAWEKLVRWSRSWRSKAKSGVLENTKKVVVLGGGSFGTAMAAHVANNKLTMEVNMLLRDPNVCRSINENHYNCKYFPEHKLPVNIVATTDAKAALTGADFCLHAVPVQFSSSFLESISEHVDPNLPFVSLSKGLELNTLRTMSQIIPQALGNPRQPFVALSGPSFALELMKNLPTGYLM